MQKAALKMKIGKLVSAILALCLIMVLSVGITTGAGAAGAAVCEIIGGEWYDSIMDAFAAVNDKQTIRLLNNVESDGIKIDGIVVTLDLNGYTYNIKRLPESDTSVGLHVINGGELRLLRPENGELNVTGYWYGVRVEKGCKATVTSSAAIISMGQSVFVDGGELTVIGVVHGRDICITVSNGGTVTVSGEVIREKQVNDDGTVSYIGTFIDFDNKAWPGINDFVTPTTKPGYLTYTDGRNTVWVRDKSGVVTPPIGTLPGMHNFVESRTYTPGQFKDVDENEWYGVNRDKFVATAYKYALMNGTGDGIFEPKAPFTVAQAISLAARVYKIYETGVGDFEQGEPWYSSFISYAVMKGVIMSSDFTLDDMERQATRAEMAYIFSGSLPDKEFDEYRNTVNSLPDVNSGMRYGESIFMLYRAGVLTGFDSLGTFNPNSGLTRAEAAGIITRVVNPAIRESGRTYG